MEADAPTPPAEGGQPGTPWHRTPMPPEAETSWQPPQGSTEEVPPGDEPPTAPPPAEPPPGSEPPATPPPAEPPVATAPAGTPPPAGGHLAAGVVLTIAGISLLAGLIGLLQAQHVDNIPSAVVCGVAFAVLFFLAVAIRPAPDRDQLRATLGVVAVLFLVACFAFAVDAGNPGSISDQSARTKLAAATGLFTLGMFVVGATVPSAVAAGLAVLGLVGTVVQAVSLAASPSVTALVVTSLLTAIAAILLALRLPLLRPHRTGLAWMLSSAALAAAIPAALLSGSLDGFSIAAVGLLGLAFTLLARRLRTVVPAIAAVPLLIAVQTFVVLRAMTDNSSASVMVLLIGVVLLVLVALAGRAARGRPVRPAGRGLLPEELVLLAAAALALIALTQPSSGAPSFFPGGFGVNGGGSAVPTFGFEQPSLEPLPSFRTLPAFPTVPAFPTLPSG